MQICKTESMSSGQVPSELLPMIKFTHNYLSFYKRNIYLRTLLLHGMQVEPLVQCYIDR